MHSLSVVDLSASTVIEGEDPDGLVEAAGHEFATRGAEVDVQDGSDVVLMDHFRLLRLSHIERITMRVFVSNHEIHRLLWVPTDCCTFIFQVDFVNGCVSTDVVEADAAVHADAC